MLRPSPAGRTVARQRAAFGSSQSISESARAARHRRSSRCAARGRAADASGCGAAPAARLRPVCVSPWRASPRSRRAARRRAGPRSRPGRAGSGHAAPARAAPRMRGRLRRLRPFGTPHGHGAGRDAASRNAWQTFFKPEARNHDQLEIRAWRKCAVLHRPLGRATLHLGFNMHSRAKSVVSPQVGSFREPSR